MQTEQIITREEATQYINQKDPEFKYLKRVAKRLPSEFAEKIFVRYKLLLNEVNRRINNLVVISKDVERIEYPCPYCRGFNECDENCEWRLEYHRELACMYINVNGVFAEALKPVLLVSKGLLTLNIKALDECDQSDNMLLKIKKFAEGVIGWTYLDDWNDDYNSEIEFRIPYNDWEKAYEPVMFIQEHSDVSEKIKLNVWSVFKEKDTIREIAAGFFPDFPNVEKFIVTKFPVHKCTNMLVRYKE